MMKRLRWRDSPVAAARLIGKVKDDAVFWINRRRCEDERVRERNESL
jgi:hypothetical protein